MARHLLLVPSLACPASCTYCFGPHVGEASMREQTVAAIVRWINALGDKDPLEITFHGGEPLVPGASFYAMALPMLRDGLAPRKIKFAMQSNLWLLTDELCELFREYGVSIGTSLDGPEAINDAQRGKGYFARTMAGIERARAHGLNPGCICTFTAQTAPRANEIFDFFVSQGLGLSVHAAMPSLRYPQNRERTLSAQAHGDLLIGLLEHYLANVDKIRVSTLDSMCRSVSAGRGGICTFGDCLGDYLAVGPDGAIYPCQRFAGMSEYRIGNVHDCPSRAQMADAPIWQMFQARQDHIAHECGDCAHVKYCRGGCPYNALAENVISRSDLCDEKSPSAMNEISRFARNDNGTLRDPHCEAYKRTFDHITEQALAEVFAPENMQEVVEHADPGKGLLRRGKLLAIMRDGPHPHETAQHARRILAAVALAATNSPDEATRKLDALGLVTNVATTLPTMRAFYQRLNTPARGLNNLYLHVTFGCNLRCTHCYADAGTPLPHPPLQGRAGVGLDAMTVEDVLRACRQAAALGFRHAVITGGEPLTHPQRDALLDALASARAELKPLLTVLRTNLVVPMNDDLLRRVAFSTDEVVVSVDGDRATHDARRGIGTYDATVGNLRRLIALQNSQDSRSASQVSLATVLPVAQANGAPGDAVRALAKELGIKRTRFRPLLPLGRAVESEIDIVPETLWAHVDPREMLEYGFNPVASCGIGQNLYVEPDGGAYPCYAWHGAQWALGNVTARDGLRGIITATAFQDLGTHTVNTNHQCQGCALRYLCGGACRAWNRSAAQNQTDLDAPPLDCSSLYQRAHSLWVSALERTQITREQWQAVGLPLPHIPPRTAKED